jgi:hypothetical protein
MVFALPRPIIGNFDPEIGCIIECGIARVGSRTIEKVRLLIDTGASHTLVSDDIAGPHKANLSIKSRGHIVGQPYTVKIYTGEIWVTGFGLLKSDFEIGELPPSLKHSAFDGFFGRDLLASSIFNLNGPDRTFTLIL